MSDDLKTTIVDSFMAKRGIPAHLSAVAYQQVANIFSEIAAAGYVVVPRNALPSAFDLAKAQMQAGVEMTSEKPSPSYATLADSATIFNPEDQFEKDRAKEDRLSKGLDQAITDELANGPKSIMEGK